MTTNKRDMFIFGLGALLFALGLGMAIFVPSNQQGAITMINMGVIMVCVRLIRKIRQERHKVIQDERTKKLSAYAYAYSWVYSFIFLGLIGWVSELHIFGEISLGFALFATMMFMVFSYIAALWFLNRKGDI